MTTTTSLAHMEAAVIGRIILDPDTLAEIRDLLEAADFAEMKHQWTFEALCRIADEGKPITTETVCFELERVGRLERLGGIAGMGWLSDGFATETTCRHYCGVIQQDAHRRAMVRAAQVIAETGGAVQDVDAYLGESAAMVREVLARSDRSEVGISLGRAVRATYDAITAGHEPPGMVPSGVDLFDKRYRGLPSCYIVVGGFPGMGKTTFADNLVLNVSLSGRHPLYISMEDSAHVIQCRMLGRLAHIDTQNLIKQQISTDEHPALVEASTKMSRVTITVIERGGMSGREIRRRAERYAKEGLADLVVVDNLQKIRERGRDLYEITTRASAEMVDLQKSLRVPVVALSQLGRLDDKTKVRKPTLGDLRGSGMIEADARMVILLHRPHYFYEIGVLKEEPDEHELAAIVAKNNYGMTGALKLYMDRVHGYIGDPPGEQQDQPDPTGGRY